MSCGVGRRWSSDLVLLWCKSAAVAPTRPLAWELMLWVWIKLFLFFIYIFLGPHPWHIQVPRLGVKSELQLLAYTTATAMPDLSHICELHYSSWQCGILHPLSEARDWTFVLLVTSQSCFHWAMIGSTGIKYSYSKDSLAPPNTLHCHKATNWTYFLITILLRCNLYT